MTQRDRWKKRDCVVRYHAFKDEVRLRGIELGDKVVAEFRVPMPKSWSKKKKSDMAGQPHQQKPDIDNFLKSLLDACFDDDSKVWSVTATKRWAEEGAILIGP